LSSPYIAPAWPNPGPIEFAGYLFPVSTWLAERDQDTNLDEIVIPLRDGSNIPTGTRKAKIITLKSTIGGIGAIDTFGNFITTRDQANAELNRLEAALSAGKQPLLVGDSDGRYIIAQRKTVKYVPEQGGNASVVGVQIDFIAEDPRWLSAALLQVPTQGGPDSVTATSDGNAITYPILTLTATGSCSNPVYQVEPAGLTGYIQVAPTVAMNTGDVLVIDSNPRNRPNAITLNGVPRLDLLSSTGALINTVGNTEFFPFFFGGGNIVSLSGTNFEWSMVWNDAFLY
jgi:hypothetical protein